MTSPEDPGVAGLLALILLTDARRDTRTDTQGRMRLLAGQDRTRWDRDGIQEGLGLVRHALRARLLRTGSRSWQRLQRCTPQRLTGNVRTGRRSSACTTSSSRHGRPRSRAQPRSRGGFAFGPQRGLRMLDDLAEEPQLAVYPYMAAARADLLRRLGRVSDARTAYEEALHLTDNDVERRYLGERLQSLAED